MFQQKNIYYRNISSKDDSNLCNTSFIVLLFCNFVVNPYCSPQTHNVNCTSKTPVRVMTQTCIIIQYAQRLSKQNIFPDVYLLDTFQVLIIHHQDLYFNLNTFCQFWHQYIKFVYMFCRILLFDQVCQLMGYFNKCCVALYSLHVTVTSLHSPLHNLFSCFIRSYA
jgi:hypothetical protein